MGRLPSEDHTTSTERARAARRRSDETVAVPNRHVASFERVRDNRRRSGVIAAVLTSLGRRFCCCGVAARIYLQIAHGPRGQSDENVFVFVVLFWLGLIVFVFSQTVQKVKLAKSKAGTCKVRTKDGKTRYCWKPETVFATAKPQQPFMLLGVVRVPSVGLWMSWLVWLYGLSYLPLSVSRSGADKCSNLLPLLACFSIQCRFALMLR